MAVTPHRKWPGWYVLDISQGMKARTRINFEGTYEEAQREYWRLKNKTAKIVTSSSRIGDHLGDFIIWYGLEHSPDTVKDFLYAWKQLEPHFGNLHFQHVDVHQVDQYKAKRLRDTYLPGNPRKKADPAADNHRRKPVSKRTITRELAYLSSFMKWAKEKGYTSHEVRIKGFPKKQTKAPIQQVHSFEEVQRIIEQTTESKRAGLDRYGLTLLMYDAGLRKKEARLIRAEEVDLPPAPVVLDEALPPYYGSIIVTRKGGKQERLPILTERLYLELQERKTHRTRGYLYINPQTLKPYRTMIAGIKSAAVRAGVTKRTTNHLLRHDFATHLHEGGADMKAIQGLLSHNDIQTTMNIYTHLDHAKLAHHAGGFAAKVSKATKKREGLGTENGGKSS